MIRMEIQKTFLSGIISMMLFVFGFSITCIAQDEDAPWSYPIYEKGAQSLMRALNEEWRKSDGEGVFDVGRRIFWALLLDPNAYYAEFSADSLSYERFSTDLSVLVFRNFSDTTTSHLENLRKVSIWRLEEMTYDIDPHYITVHQEMIENLKRVEVSFVD